MGRYPSKKLMEAANDQDREMVKHALQLVGMEEFLDRSFLTLSGGEKQRVLIARALAQETEMVILDEPTNHLDDETKNALRDALISYPGNVLLVTHEASFYDGWTDRIFDVEQIRLNK